MLHSIERGVNPIRDYILNIDRPIINILSGMRHAQALGPAAYISYYCVGIKNT